MAISRKDYQNERVGGALIMALSQIDYVRELIDNEASPAEIEHAFVTAEEAIEVGRRMIHQAEDVSRERKSETLGWMDNYAADLAALRPQPSTH